MSDKKTISVYVDYAMADDLAARAESVRMSLSKYIVLVLEQHMQSGKKLELKEKMARGKF